MPTLRPLPTEKQQYDFLLTWLYFVLFFLFFSVFFFLFLVLKKEAAQAKEDGEASRPPGHKGKVRAWNTLFCLCRVGFSSFDRPGFARGGLLTIVFAGNPFRVWGGERPIWTCFTWRDLYVCRS